MTSEEKQPIPPEDAYPELVEEDVDLQSELETLVLEDSDTPTPAAPGSESATPTPEAGEDAAFIAQLRQELALAQQQIKDHEDRYVRLYADFENFRRRTLREKEEQAEREKQKFVLEILPIVDNFERAQQQVKLETDRERSIHNSYQSVYRLLVDALKKMGVARIKAAGQPFDPKLHEAIARQPSPDLPEDTILMEYQAGFLLGDFVVRPAKVSVSYPGDATEAGATEHAAQSGAGSEPTAEASPPEAGSGDAGEAPPSTEATEAPPASGQEA